MAMYEQTVQSVHHWTDKTFSFKIDRPDGFRFRNGEFVMIGLDDPDQGKILRAYSIASPNWAEELEFLSIKVADGPLTSRLQHMKPGDKVIMNRKSVGTLVLDTLQPGRNLYLFATGTGLAPFMSVAFDPETYEQYEKVILVHTVRTMAEHAYRDELTNLIKHEYLADTVHNKFVYVPTVTRENDDTGFALQGRCSTLLKNGSLSKSCDIPAFDVNTDAAMICGSTGMNQEFIQYFESLGGKCGSASQRGCFVYEKAFVD
tara:strand:- start:1106 stop:1885 length:780 start_codon:yes stop_codon:yes gene_type:complete